MNMVQRLVKIADRVDAKGIHSVAEDIDQLINTLQQEVGSTSDPPTAELEAAVRGYFNPLGNLIRVANELDNRGLLVLADKVDKIIELEALKTQSAIDVVLSIYKRKHEAANVKGFCRVAGIRKDNTEAKCPFGLPIPEGCQNVGALVSDMDENEPEKNQQIYKSFKPGEACPFAADILEKQRAVNCNYGTPLAGVEMPELYHGSPIYPKLWEGFNTVNLDRSYQTTDFSNYSLYGGLKGFCKRGN